MTSLHLLLKCQQCIVLVYSVMVIIHEFKTSIKSLPNPHLSFLDIVFFVFLYQRWIYRVDMKRVNEFGYSADMDDKAPGELTNKEAPAIESSDKKADKKTDKKKVKSSADKKDD